MLQAEAAVAEEGPCPAEPWMQIKPFHSKSSLKPSVALALWGRVAPSGSVWD